MRALYEFRLTQRFRVRADDIGSVLSLEGVDHLDRLPDRRCGARRQVRGVLGDRRGKLVAEDGAGNGDANDTA